jgi:hypothetical protein
MAYDGARSYISGVITAQNIISTASNHVCTATLNSVVFPISEPTFLCSIAMICTASSAAQINLAKYLILQTNTTSIGSISIATQTLNMVSTATFLPPVALPAGTWINLLAMGTGTASATYTASAQNFIIGLAPQYV